MIASGRTPHTVGDVMTRTLITTDDATTVHDAMHQMRQSNVSSLVVEPNADGVWGIMTRRDIVTKIVKENKSPVDLTVGQIATRPVITVPPQTHLHEAANVISEKNVSRLLVEKDGEMVGITTETDIFGAIEQFGWIPEPE
ncbi:MAG: CBS domain-containing protein [Salinisphaeraceae bacterium]|uniref:CBS domain-containing protein n=3 Tax=Spectribacter TaxID=3160928 RepID=A0ABU3BXK2_9GAMM|nr:CBS domain-containing protein [Salinisphaera sp. W335]MDT0634028.1 CBS domain-containing protein [Salinisphaera sp. W335]